MKYAGEAGIPRDTAWSQLTPAQHDWVLERHAELERQVEPAVVRHPPLLRLPGEQGLQDAHPRAAVQVPQLHAVHGLRRRAAEAGSAAVAAGRQGQRRCGAAAGASATCRSARPGRATQLEALPGLSLHDLMLLPIDAAAPLLRQPAAARCAARRSAEAAARGDRHAAEVPVRRRPRLPDAGPAEPHAQRRRGAAHQPDHRARHLAGEHDVRARRAEHRPAPARHGPHRRGDAPAARRRQHAGGGRARPGGDAGRRPPDRHGPGPGRARRADRLRRHARRGAPRRHADRRLPRRAQAGRHRLPAPGERRHAEADRSKARASTT